MTRHGVSAHRSTCTYCKKCILNIFENLKIMKQKCGHTSGYAMSTHKISRQGGIFVGCAKKTNKYQVRSYVGVPNFFFTQA
jgi:ssDNA-binding Zn-finger/Zn-ribbon topoisomerase 1